MKRLSMRATESVTFKEGCEKYLDNCRQRNLREGTIKVDNFTLLIKDEIKHQYKNVKKISNISKIPYSYVSIYYHSSVNFRFICSS